MIIIYFIENIICGAAKAGPTDAEYSGSTPGCLIN
jgi:hypothetical protein